LDEVAYRNKGEWQFKCDLLLQRRPSAGWRKCSVVKKLTLHHKITKQHIHVWWTSG